MQNTHVYRRNLRPQANPGDFLFLNSLYFRVAVV